MNTEFNLPEQVKQAVHQNRKIEAIKLLREQTGMGLKEAKYLVEDYARAHPDLIRAAQPASASGSTNLLLVIAVAVIAYGIYRLIS